MPASQRAKQFAPFDAVVGLRAALKEKEKIKVCKKTVSDDMAEEIDWALKNLKIGNFVTVIHYDEIGGEYLQVTGRVTEIDFCNKILEADKKQIKFKDVYSIIRNID